jgi:hypothetical protein
LEFLTRIFQKMVTAPNRYEPLNLQHGPPRPTKDPPRLHSYLTSRQHMADSAECWPNTSWKVSITKENLQLPSSCQGCIRIKNARCIQYPMWMWQGLYWAHKTQMPGESPKRKNTTFTTWWKFEIKKHLFYSNFVFAFALWKMFKVGWFSWNPTLSSNSLQVATGLSRHPQTMDLH